MGRGEALLSLERVQVQFPIDHRRRVTAVAGVDLSLQEGETLGLIGESGSGKSTIARALVGLAPVNSGIVRWQGTDVSTFSRKDRRRFSENVQMVFQDPHSALDPRRTIAQSVREPLDVMNRGESGDRADMALAALESVGLSSHHMSRYPHQLSGGQKQRANIARALVTNPRVLICDESVAALDVALQAEILNLLQDLKAEYELTMMFISHDLSVVAHVADRISVMYLGKIVENAEADSINRRPRHPYSEALLSAQPHVHGDNAARRIVLKGDIPSPVSPPQGCRFNTRCPHALESCAEREPMLMDIAENHSSACWRVDEIYPRDVRAETAQ